MAAPRIKAVRLLKNHGARVTTESTRSGLTHRFVRPDGLLTTFEAAKLLNTYPNMITRMLRAGRLDGCDTGRGHQVSLASCRALLRLPAASRVGSAITPSTRSLPVATDLDKIRDLVNAAGESRNAAAFAMAGGEVATGVPLALDSIMNSLLAITLVQQSRLEVAQNKDSTLGEVLTAAKNALARFGVSGEPDDVAETPDDASQSWSEFNELLEATAAALSTVDSGAAPQWNRLRNAYAAVTRDVPAAPMAAEPGSGPIEPALDHAAMMRENIGRSRPAGVAPEVPQ